MDSCVITQNNTLYKSLRFKARTSPKPYNHKYTSKRVLNNERVLNNKYISRTRTK